MRKKITTQRLCLAALFMAMNVVLSSSYFSIPVPGGHFYLNDIVICLAALLLDPISAAAVGGLGSFLGDFFFYPAPMFVSLVTRGVQGAVIALIAHKSKRAPTFVRALLGVAAGAVIMVVGYTLGRAFVYQTPAYAWLKLPFQILQAVLGAAVSLPLYFNTPLKKLGKLL